MDSQATLVGNATRDPELRFTNGGTAVVSFGLAVNRKWTDATGTKQEQVSFFDVKAWGSLAENVSGSITKGARIIVTGRLEQESWEKDGQKHSKVALVADEVGPSLRWATAAVDKVQRSDQPAASRQTAPAAAPSGGYSEDPF